MKKNRGAVSPYYRENAHPCEIGNILKPILTEENNRKYDIKMFDDV